MKNMYKVIICGDRYWTNRKAIRDFILHTTPLHTMIIEGGCSGADKIAMEEALSLNRCVCTIFANWKVFGKSAGPIRNLDMIDEHPNLVVAFHNNIKNSKGTKDMLRLAKKHKVNWMLCNENGIVEMETYEK